MAGTSKPTSGTVDVEGRVSALLELGAGFHPDFTGRENVYLNASLLGLSRKQTEGVLPDIIAFAELGDFFDAAVKTYSSGMYTRLAFSVAAFVDPDVLLIDEVPLHSGDEATHVVRSGAPFEIRLAYSAAEERDVVFGVLIYRDDGVSVFGTNTKIDAVPVRARRSGHVSFCVDALPLLPGKYELDVAASSPELHAYG